jgi:hypothetical protein
MRRRRSTDYKAENGPREVRSFEMPHAHALWHLDFRVPQISGEGDEG